MLVNVVRYDKDKADPIVNHMPLDVGKGQFSERWYMWEYHEIKHPGLSTKQIFKKVFGKQLTCVYTHWYRSWVWTFSNSPLEPAATIYCMVDKRGIHWHMDIGSNLRGISDLREEIEKRLIA
jgi:hypothetical protein